MQTGELRLEPGHAGGESQLQVIFDNIADGVMVMDRELRHVYVNRAGAAMCGYGSPEELLNATNGETLSRFELLTEDDQPFPPERLPARLVFNGVASTSNVVVKFRDRSTNIVRVSSVTSRPILDRNGAPYLAVSIFRDITEAKTLEAELKRSVQAFSYLAEVSAVLSSSLDYEKTLGALAKTVVPRIADWCFVYMNEGSAIRTAAVEHADPSLREAARLLDEKYPIDWLALKGPSEVLRSGKPLLVSEVTEERLRNHAKAEEHFAILKKLEMNSVLMVPLRGSNQIWGALSLVATRRRSNFTRADLIMAEAIGRRAGLAIDNAKLFDQAQEAIRIRDEFISIASHELRTPVTSLKLQAQMAKRAIEKGNASILEPANMSKTLHSVIRQADRLNRLVDDMLDISRISHGKLAIHPEPAELAAIVREAMDRFEEQFKSEGVKYRLNLESSVTGVWDGYRIDQVVTNLISNALKYGRGSTIEVSVFAEGPNAIVRVRDQGMGIAKENLERIFQRFERAVSPGEISGMGLGLYISKQIISAHDGEITVESEIGKGSTFTVLLPTCSQASD